jgi:hypothetical protein
MSSACKTKGPPKPKQTQNSVTPVVGGWVRGQKGTGVRFFKNIFVLFLKSPPRKAPKNVVKENRERTGFGFLVDYLVKTFDTIVLQNIFCSGFELPSLINT